MASTEAGWFITFEGGEGAGKTTQLRLLAEALRQNGRSVVMTREPGGSPGAEEIRRLLVEGEPGRWDAMTETLLHFAARRDHLQRTVRPALARGEWVLCDRYTDSTLAYQGFAGGLPLSSIHQLHALAADGVQPDMTVILDLPVEEGLRRAAGRGGAEDRYERMGLEFHRKLRQGFLDIAAQAPRRCVVLSAEGSVEAVRARIWAAVMERLG